MGRKPASHPFREDDPMAALLDRLLSAEQIGELMHADPSTVFRWVREGRFPKPLKIGGMTRWRARDYNEWVQQQVADNA
jgi:prophage regulatory protein